MTWMSDQNSDKIDSFQRIDTHKGYSARRDRWRIKKSGGWVGLPFPPRPKINFIVPRFLVPRQYLRSTTRAKHPPIASSSRHRPGTQHSPLITGVFFIGTSERHRRAT